MTKITIIRIEHPKTHNGPYNHCIWGKWRKRLHEAHTHPCPIIEGLIESSAQMKKYKSGFNSINQLKKWFSKAELKRMRNEGFQIIKFELSSIHVNKGKKQLIFNPKARRSNIKIIDIKKII